MKINSECKVGIPINITEVLKVLKGYDKIYIIKSIKPDQMS